MAIRIKHKVNVKAANDTSMKNKLFEFDDTLAEVVIDTYQRQNSGKFIIPATTTENIPTGDVTAVKGALVLFDASCTIAINGSADLISIVKPASSTWAKFFIEATVTQIAVTAGAADLEGVFCVWGDATS